MFTPTLSEGVAYSDVPPNGEVPFGYYEDYLVDFASGSSQWVSSSPGLEQGSRYYRYDTYDVMGASSDLSHVLFTSSRHDELYEWAGGRAVPVDVDNSGTIIAAGAGFDNVDVWHAVSADGSRVFFTSGGGELYVRENIGQPQSPVEAGRCTVPADACTVLIAEGVGGPNFGGPIGSYFQGANSEGSKVFFTKNGDLFEFDVDTEQTTDLAPGADVQSVSQISEDGSYVYFVADGGLAGGAVAGEPNLYVWHGGGAPAYIATLAQGDQDDWLSQAFGSPSESPVDDSAAVTPNGARFAFVSERSLTGYDNEEAESGECGGEGGRCREVYLYDAESNRLECASCNPSGARPVGDSSLRSGGSSPFSSYKQHSFSEDGTLFFDSDDALVPHDSNGREDVYEYRDGHVYPISDVTGGYNSFLLDVDPKGENVFFATADQLVGQDRGNNRIAVYDARVDGGFPSPVSVAACDNGDSCKPPPTPQPGAFGAPASATFSGAGNPTPVVPASTVNAKAKAKPEQCRKGYVKRSGRCVKRGLKGKAKTKRSSVHSKKGRKS